MTDQTQFATTLVDQLLSSGSKAIEGAARLNQVGLSAFKQILEKQLELGKAFAELGSSQFKSLSDIGAPQDLLQRQKEAGEAFGGKLQTYFEELRGIAQDAQQAYAKAGQETAADLSSKG